MEKGAGRVEAQPPVRWLDHGIRNSHSVVLLSGVQRDSECTSLRGVFFLSFLELKRNSTFNVSVVNKKIKILESLANPKINFSFAAVFDFEKN